MAVHWDTSQVRTLAIDLGRNATGAVGAKVSAIIRKGAFAIERDAKILCPVDTGNLRNSIGVDITGDGRFGGIGAIIGPTANYGLPVETGVPHPYIIRAKDGGFLRFTIDGRVIYARQVTHPASLPRPYMAPAFDRNEPGIREAIGQAGEESVL